MKKYYPTINLLRGIAALMVCLYHFICFSNSSGALFPVESKIRSIALLGVNGVFAFFVISGFVIPLSLYKYNFKIKQIHQFILRRFIRIELPYLASIGLIFFIWFVFSIRNGTSFTIDIKQLVYHLFYLIPFTSYSWYNIIYWTLAIEFQFYLFIGLFYLLMINKNKILSFSTILLFLGVNFFVDNHSIVFYYSVIFLQGIILFLIQSNQIKKSIGFALILLCVMATAYIHSPTTAIFCLTTVLAIFFIEINHPFSNHFGDVSYSLYLTHGAIGVYIIARYYQHFESLAAKVGLIALALIASLVFAHFYWKLIENPAKKLAQKIRFS